MNTLIIVVFNNEGDMGRMYSLKTEANLKIQS